MNMIQHERLKTLSDAVEALVEVLEEEGGCGDVLPELKELKEGLKGGPGSGHHGHTGRPGKRGGSSPGKGPRTTGPGIDRPISGPADKTEYFTRRDAEEMVGDKHAYEVTQDEFSKYHVTGYIQTGAYKRATNPETSNFYSEDSSIRYTEETHPILLEKQTIDGMEIEFRQSIHKNQYTYFDEETVTHRRDAEGNLVYRSDAEIVADGLPLWDDSIAAFYEGRAVGTASNEWGATGVWVLDPYQGHGIGMELLSRIRKYPWLAKHSMGQATPAGMGLVKAYHRRLVREALEAGELVPERVLKDYPGLKGVGKKGGPGSGNWGHAGRPGKVGGSLPGGGLSTIGVSPIFDARARRDFAAMFRKRWGKTRLVTEGDVTDRTKAIIAETYGQFPKWARERVNRIVLKEEAGHTFEAGEQQFQSGATWHQASGTLTMHNANLYGVVVRSSTRQTLGHEIGHNLHADWWNGANAQADAVFKKHPDWIDMAGNLKPGLEEKFAKLAPLHIAQRRFLAAWEAGEDGVNDYTKAWAKDGRFSETAAEMFGIYLSQGRAQLMKRAREVGAEELAYAVEDAAKYFEKHGREL